MKYKSFASTPSTLVGRYLLHSSHCLPRPPQPGRPPGGGRHTVFFLQPRAPTALSATHSAHHHSDTAHSYHCTYTTALGTDYCSSNASSCPAHTAGDSPLLGLDHQYLGLQPPGQRGGRHDDFFLHARALTTCDTSALFVLRTHSVCPLTVLTESSAEHELGHG